MASPTDIGDQARRGLATPPIPEPRRDFWRRRFPLTDVPNWLMLVLVGVGVPRTVLADLDIVAPESSWLYYVLALGPFAVWLVVAVLRRTRKPFLDFLVLGLLYGASLVVVHEALWEVGPSLGHNPPASAVDFAEQFDPPWRDFALRRYTDMIAMMIGAGSGVVAALVSVVSARWRSRRTGRTPERSS